MEQMNIVKPIPFPISREEIWELGQRLRNEEQRAMFYTLYLTGARVSEALQIQKRDVWMEQVGDNNVLVFKVLTSKVTSMIPTRNLPVPCLGIEGNMAMVVWQYRENLGREEERLFHYSRRRAYNICTGLIVDTRAINPDRTYTELLGFKLHPHYLRHCRATHLVVYHGMNNPYDLMKWFGWTDPRRPMTYLQLDWRDMLKVMLSQSRV
jgi:integrase